ncbi:hypothetical protein [Pseudomonas sp. Pf153]|uniref:hypothetical protein n=1 Tax=Pseudomonas sp. Pf153 TaxID=1699309 RepID=UPI00069FC9CC|nr:hypothetical protein [Pseudomonas sp. Pf153]
MLMFRKYSPQFTTPSEIEAKRYAAKLVWPATIVALMLHFPMAQPVAALLVVALLLWVVVVGKRFRIHQPDFAAEHPLWRQLWVLKLAAKFVVVATVVIGVALGQAQWKGTTIAIHAVLEWFMTFKAMAIALWS